jgi:hypothetical protein
MRRRQFLGVLGWAALWPFGARSQGTAVPVIGYLSPSSNSTDYVKGLFVGLRELSYIDGRNIHIESRWADGKLDQLPTLAAELVRLNVNVLVTSVTEASLQAKKAIATIPIVMAAVGDPVAAGLVASLSRPGGNVTGTSSLSIDIVGKQIELLKVVVYGTLTMPHIRRFSCRKRNVRRAPPAWSFSWWARDRQARSRKPSTASGAGRRRLPFLVTQCWCNMQQQSPSLR